MLHEVGASTATVRRQLTVVKSFCTWLHGQGFMDASLIQSLRGPKPHDALPDVPSEEDMRRLLEGEIPGRCPSRDRALLELLYGAGLRAAEAIAINIADFQDDRIVVIHGKGNRDRHAVFGEPCQQAIAAWLSVRERLLKEVAIKTDALFCSVSNRRSERLAVRNVNRIVARIAEANGLPKFNPHALRHACATHSHDRGMPLQAVAMMLGHEQLDSTQIYTRVSTGRMLDVYRKAHPHAKRVA
jgi:integrase/recombinase XerC